MSAPALPTIGTKFLFPRTPRSSERAVWTVKDVWTTTNASGKVIKTEYRATHPFTSMVVEAGFLAVTIQRAIESHGVPE
jgi:hypothetical protein